jgi:uncharacterized protein with HEPN domain
MKVIKQRNVFAHRYFHTFEKVQWTEAWEMVAGEFPDLRRLLDATIKDMKNLPNKEF